MGPVRPLSTAGGRWPGCGRVPSGEIHSTGATDRRRSSRTCRCPELSKHFARGQRRLRAIILGMEEKRQNWDKLGANVNLIRTRTLLEDADIVRAGLEKSIGSGTPPSRPVRQPRWAKA